MSRPNLRPDEQNEPTTDFIMEDNDEGCWIRVNGPNGEPVDVRVRADDDRVTVTLWAKEGDSPLAYAELDFATAARLAGE